MENLRWVLRAPEGAAGRFAESMAPAWAEEALCYHRGFPQYAPTPMRELRALAGRLGLGGVFVKDESPRFGLNAFKVLGGSYAIGRHVAAALGLAMADVTRDFLTGPACREALRGMVFFTATDGNHGRGVAWTARELGCRAVVRMPKGTAASRVNNIRALGAEVSVESCGYDDCVRLAARQAAETPGGVLVQDTAWPGYEEIPLWIMRGYLTMAREADEQLRARPTHLFLQAGVGSMAAAVAGYFACRYPDAPPTVTVLEPVAADCFFQSARAGRRKNTAGDLNTMMAGLACGEPNPIAWDILGAHGSAFLACGDEIAARGMRLLAAPLPGDEKIVSGESGAVGAGALWEIMTEPACAPLREALKLDKTSRVLMISTEGATDPENYRRVVDGTPPR